MTKRQKIVVPQETAIVLAGPCRSWHTFVEMDARRLALPLFRVKPSDFDELVEIMDQVTPGMRLVFWAGDYNPVELSLFCNRTHHHGLVVLVLCEEDLGDPRRYAAINQLETSGATLIRSAGEIGTVMKKNFERLAAPGGGGWASD